MTDAEKLEAIHQFLESLNDPDEEPLSTFELYIITEVESIMGKF